MRSGADPRAPRLVQLLVVVAVGGAVGAVVRYTLDQAVPDGGGFPATTFAINITGSFLLALLPAFGGVRRSRIWTVALGPGLLGGYTTLSAYSEQSRALLGAGHPTLAAAYVLGTLAACLLAVRLADLVSTRAQEQDFADEGGDE